LALALAFATRTPMVFGALLFLLEAWRVCQRGAPSAPFGQRVDARRFLSLVARFAIPIAGVGFLMALHNQLRFGEVGEFGYRFLEVRWQDRIQQWGLFHYRYLGKNLAVLLTGLPWVSASGSLQVNGHGLALWVTSPFYLWLLWPRRFARVQRAVALTALAVALPTLFYQNTGWVQFGYRFSNDYSVCLVLLLALGGYRMGRAMAVAIGWSVLVNAMGAATFGRAAYRDHYVIDPTQRTLRQTER
jgi:hypothetical protein